MGKKVMKFIGGILIGVLIALVVGSLIVWQLQKHMRVEQKAPPAPAMSVAEPEKVAEVAPPVEKKPAVKAVKKKKTAKKPPVPLPAPVREERTWERWNAAPYATSREEACKKAPEAIDGFSFPTPVKEQFKKLLGTTCKGGTEAWLTPGTLLEEMMSGPDAHHKQSYVMRKRTVAELPVLQSPDGRPYRNGTVAETAKALAWRVEHEGKSYVLYLPFVCFNWSWKFGVPPLPPPPPPVLRPAPVPVPLPPVQEECATVEYAVQPGDEVRFAVLAQRRLPASACWQLCDGADCAAPPSPCDDPNCWREVQDTLPAGFEPQHTGKYVARSAKQSLRLPREARMNFIALCVTREWFGQSNSWIVQPSAWNAFGKKTKLHVPYGGYAWPVWGEETIWPGWEYQPGY